MSESRLDVCFVVTPFLPEHQPALGVSSLQAVLEREGWRAATRYLNIDYAREIGFGPSSHIGGGLPVELLLGEMIFARALWGDAAPAWAEYEERLREWLASPQARRGAVNLDALLQAARPLHEEAPRTVSRWADELIALNPHILGFTTTFQQNVASLALAREVRRRVPASDIAIIFGGANCEGEMGRGLADNFRFVDLVVSGEAEGLVVEVVSGIRGGGTLEGPRYRTGRVITDLDALPVPVFDDYIGAIAATEMQASFNLVAESSRGCWWGAKSHCTFCGLNGGSMAYRSKAPERFGEELRLLSERYGSRSFMLADNIMDMGYLRTLFPRMTAEGEAVELFYETKANLRKEQLEVMAAAGVARLQPGIESLSTPLLKLMAKGTTLLQNLQLLRWAEELGVGLAWNVLTGFPGEEEAWYDEMTALVPRLHHLPPPTGTGLIRLDRFSPFWASPERHGIAKVRPFWAYDLIYRPLDPEQRARIAYFFEFDYASGQRPADYALALWLAVEGWRERHASGAALELVPGDDASIVDSRNGAPTHTPVSGLEQAVLRRLDRAARARSLSDLLPDAVARESLITDMERRGWIAREGELYVSLVIDRRERERVTARRIALRLESIGLASETLEAAE